ncbi:alpha/beta fold hydrolase [Paraburkholderia bannensis]|uniref:alpha/beta fold hydrolase n=1 Tax=Paraburkholderia bannensis TaxID=765414 RepID=UPI0005A884AE|nr:alpha/beta hydrolase [Paraburkholderia bannensis]
MSPFAIDDRGNMLRYLELFSASYSADPLVFIHGLGCASSSDYPSVVNSASYTKRRSLLVDLMGSGFSDKPLDGSYDSTAQAAALSKLLSGESFTKVNLFGHSAGAFIALQLARQLADQTGTLILCEPGLTDYGVAMLADITSMSEQQFVEDGFTQLRAQLKSSGGNEAWLGPFSVASPYAIYHWARSALEDNAHLWLDDLAALKVPKAVILSDTASGERIAQFEQAGCTVARVANAEHMIAYENPDGLAAAISTLLD